MHRRTLGLTLGCALSAFANAAAAANPAFAAPSGFQGAGLGMGDQRVRAWTEATFYTQEAVTTAAATFGAGYRVSDSLELEALLPIAYSSLKTLYTDDSAGGVRSEREDALAVGNPYLGIGRVHLEGTLRYKAGLGVTLPIGTDEYPDAAAGAVTAATYGLQDLHLWYPHAMALAAPLRIEIGDPVVLGVDAMPVLFLFTSDVVSKDTEFFVQVAPGAGVYATDELLVGARLPVACSGDIGDGAQVALEPYARFDVGGGFLNARFTVNLDETLGFAFDTGKYWGAHLGGGLVF
ncbi:MAG TPA: hypothetical protein VI072_27715 [Polyangiaceae bacterium]